jgi:hypothetical protein
MRPHPRPPNIRKKIKSVGTVAAVLLASAWVGSGWFSWHSPVSRSRPFAGISSGRLFCGWYRQPRDIVDPTTREEGAALMVELVKDAEMFQTLRAIRRGGDPAPPSHLVASFIWARGPSGWVLAMPIWAMLPPLALAVGLAHRRHAIAARRERAVSMGLCPKCNYDRSGVPSAAPCPECGVPPV